MKKKVSWYTGMGFAGFTDKGYFIVDDNASDDEIEEMAKDAAFDCFDWGYTVEAVEGE